MEYFDVVLKHLFPLVGSIVLASLPFLIEAFRRYLKEKHNFEVSQTVIDRYKEFVYDGIYWMEEQASKKKKAGEDPTPSVEKLSGTLGFVVDAAKTAGLPAWSEGQLKKLIESALNSERQ